MISLPYARQHSEVPSKDRDVKASARHRQGDGKSALIREKRRTVRMMKLSTMLKVDSTVDTQGGAVLQNECWSIGSMTQGQHNSSDRAQTSCTSSAKEVNAPFCALPRVPNGQEQPLRQRWLFSAGSQARE